MLTLGRQQIHATISLKRNFLFWIENIIYGNIDRSLPIWPDYSIKIAFALPKLINCHDLCLYLF